MSKESGTAALPAGSVLRRDATPIDEAPTRAGREEEASAGSRPPRKRRRLKIVLVALLALLGVFVASAVWIENTGWKFFHTGKGAVETLAQMGKALGEGDLQTFESLLADDYRGALLGLGDLRLTGDRDGVRVYALTSVGDAADKAAAVAEWRAYLETFESVDEAALYIHRLEEWGDPAEVVASVRYELIGTPAGEARAGIDRAFFRFHFRETEDRFEVFRGSLVEGDRMIATEPHFTEVAAAAGVDFENQYYPAFLPENREQPLKFGMLKYGPAGVTAADVDNDGFYDLFIPDGVEAKLFRNTGDGRFEDITAAAGLDGLDGVGVGLFADADNDGVKDFFVSRTFQPNQLFRGNGVGPDGVVTFTEVTAESGIGEDCCTTVASWGDIDNDGDLDLYVGRYLEPRLAIPTTFYARNGEPNQLYRNDGDFRFTNITEASGTGELGLCLGSVFGDYDDDGDADLYVVNDFGRKTLYRNDGVVDGVARFADVTVETDSLAYGAGMSASFGDYDNDLDLDIYVAHIRSEHGWYAEWPTVLRYMMNTWRQGVWVTDMPLYIEIMRQSGLDFIQVFQDMAAGNALLKNLGDGTFADVSWDAGANPPGWFWGSGFYDFDNDGWQDVYSANGWVYNNLGTEIELDFLNNVVSEMQEYKTGSFFDPNNFGTQSWHGWERNRHLRNLGPGEDRGDGPGEVRFEEIGRAAGTDLLLNSRGIAVADYWNRGVLDVAVAASTDRHALLRNDVGGRRNWLAVELVGAAGTLPDGTNRDAVGARVILEAGGQAQMREVFLGDGYGSQNALRLHFGLGGELAPGEAPVIDELVVKWPRSGREQRFTGVAANRIVEIAEGRDEVVEKVYGVLPDEPDA